MYFLISSLVSPSLPS
ncbi:uncharacterized protein CELE_F44E5.17 [Caenorhabditis elegans]|uniref:Uncharacterized protein n=1 Tax=Caenorhabditis elegans TaxID=6239 RepID=A0A2K5ATQ7_CAEEL|nr:Uncharacterized protein CELE_F44E5.17 [Caenorhabditis elegans]SPC47294.2 Uncharacterized protein CELE_F44E5.17 [Caenorhabditis elegans]|eukprot:NP_001348707.2 Uncharacterized protein CELE_F44E5.17 [Caenorhabditis elegans]